MNKNSNVFQQLRNLLISRAATKTVLISLGLYLLSLVALNIYDLQIARIAPGITKPDLTFGYTPAVISEIFTTLGAEGRQIYLQHLVVDSFMPVLFCPCGTAGGCACHPPLVGAAQHRPTYLYGPRPDRKCFLCGHDHAVSGHLDRSGRCYQRDHHDQTICFHGRHANPGADLCRMDRQQPDQMASIEPAKKVMH
jgi:hypothetical protein